MSDTIFIKGVSVHAHHGVLDHESHVGQRFVIDLELTADIAEAVLAAFPKISAVKVTVHKPHAPIAAIFDDVGVILTRTRQ